MKKLTRTLVEINLMIQSLCSLVDGFKPGQRKVIFTCLKRNLTKKEIKVAQLAGSVAEVSRHLELKVMGPGMRIRFP